MTGSIAKNEGVKIVSTKLVGEKMDAVKIGEIDFIYSEKGQKVPSFVKMVDKDGDGKLEKFVCEGPFAGEQRDKLDRIGRSLFTKMREEFSWIKSIIATKVMKCGPLSAGDRFETVKCSYENLTIMLDGLPGERTPYVMRFVYNSDEVGSYGSVAYANLLIGVQELFQQGLYKEVPKGEK